MKGKPYKHGPAVVEKVKALRATGLSLAAIGAAFTPKLKKHVIAGIVQRNDIDPKPMPIVKNPRPRPRRAPGVVRGVKNTLPPLASLAGMGPT